MFDHTKASIIASLKSSRMIPEHTLWPLVAQLSPNELITLVLEFEKTNTSIEQEHPEYLDYQKKWTQLLLILSRVLFFCDPLVFSQFLKNNTRLANELTLWVMEHYQDVPDTQHLWMKKILEAKADVHWYDEDFFNNLIDYLIDYSLSLNKEAVGELVVSLGSLWSQHTKDKKMQAAFLDAFFQAPEAKDFITDVVQHLQKSDANFVATYLTLTNLPYNEIGALCIDQMNLGELILYLSPEWLDWVLINLPPETLMNSLEDWITKITQVEQTDFKRLAKILCFMPEDIHYFHSCVRNSRFQEPEFCAKLVKTLFEFKDKAWLIRGILELVKKNCTQALFFSALLGQLTGSHLRINPSSVLTSIPASTPQPLHAIPMLPGTKALPKYIGDEGQLQWSVPHRDRVSPRDINVMQVLIRAFVADFSELPWQDKPLVEQVYSLLDFALQEEENTSSINIQMELVLTVASELTSKEKSLVARLTRCDAFLNCLVFVLNSPKAPCYRSSRLFNLVLELAEAELPEMIKESSPFQQYCIEAQLSPPIWKSKEHRESLNKYLTRSSLKQLIFTLLEKDYLDPWLMQQLSLLNAESFAQDLVNYLPHSRYPLRVAEMLMRYPERFITLSSAHFDSILKALHKGEQLFNLLECNCPLASKFVLVEKLFEANKFHSLFDEPSSRMSKKLLATVANYTMLDKDNQFAEYLKKNKSAQNAIYDYLHTPELSMPLNSGTLLEYLAFYGFSHPEKGLQINPGFLGCVSSPLEAMQAQWRLLLRFEKLDSLLQIIRDNKDSISEQIIPVRWQHRLQLYFNGLFPLLRTVPDFDFSKLSPQALLENLPKILQQQSRNPNEPLVKASLKRHRDELLVLRSYFSPHALYLLQSPSIYIDERSGQPQPVIQTEPRLDVRAKIQSWRDLKRYDVITNTKKLLKTWLKDHARLDHEEDALWVIDKILFTGYIKWFSDQELQSLLNRFKPDVLKYFIMRFVHNSKTDREHSQWLQPLENFSNWAQCNEHLKSIEEARLAHLAKRASDFNLQFLADILNFYLFSSKLNLAPLAKNQLALEGEYHSLSSIEWFLADLHDYTQKMLMQDIMLNKILQLGLTYLEEGANAIKLNLLIWCYQQFGQNRLILSLLNSYTPMLDDGPGDAQIVLDAFTSLLKMQKNSDEFWRIFDREFLEKLLEKAAFAPCKNQFLLEHSVMTSPYQQTCLAKVNARRAELRNITPEEPRTFISEEWSLGECLAYNPEHFIDMVALTRIAAIHQPASRYMTFSEQSEVHTKKRYCAADMTVFNLLTRIESPAAREAQEWLKSTAILNPDSYILGITGWAEESPALHSDLLLWESAIFDDIEMFVSGFLKIFVGQENTEKGSLQKTLKRIEERQQLPLLLSKAKEFAALSDEHRMQLCDMVVETQFKEDLWDQLIDLGGHQWLENATLNEEQLLLMYLAGFKNPNYLQHILRSEESCNQFIKEIINKKLSIQVIANLRAESHNPEIISLLTLVLLQKQEFVDSLQGEPFEAQLNNELIDTVRTHGSVVKVNLLHLSSSVILALPKESVVGFLFSFEMFGALTQDQVDYLLAKLAQQKPKVMDYWLKHYLSFPQAAKLMAKFYCNNPGFFLSVMKGLDPETRRSVCRQILNHATLFPTLDNELIKLMQEEHWLTAIDLYLAGSIEPNLIDLIITLGLHLLEKQGLSGKAKEKFTVLAGKPVFTPLNEKAAPACRKAFEALAASGSLEPFKIFGYLDFSLLCARFLPAQSDDPYPCVLDFYLKNYKGSAETLKEVLDFYFSNFAGKALTPAELGSLNSTISLLDDPEVPVAVKSQILASCLPYPSCLNNHTSKTMIEYDPLTTIGYYGSKKDYNSVVTLCKLAGNNFRTTHAYHAELAKKAMKEAEFELYLSQKTGFLGSIRRAIRRFFHKLRNWQNSTGLVEPFDGKIFASPQTVQNALDALGSKNCVQLSLEINNILQIAQTANPIELLPLAEQLLMPLAHFIHSPNTTRLPQDERNLDRFFQRMLELSQSYPAIDSWVVRNSENFLKNRDRILELELARGNPIEERLRNYGKFHLNYVNILRQFQHKECIKSLSVKPASVMKAAQPKESPTLMNSMLNFFTPASTSPYSPGSVSPR